MKLNWKIPAGLKTHFEAELHMSKIMLAKGDFRQAWHFLERAHILGQAWPVQHTKAHWKMILFACRIKDTKEIIGQIPRLIMGGVKSFVGKIPVGNTGGADVSPLKPMGISADLRDIINKYSRN